LTTHEVLKQRFDSTQSCV